VSDEIVFFHHPNSRGRMVHWMLEECGAPYRVHLLDFAKGDHKSAEYLALNPMGKVPCVVHRGVVVTEAAAICAYLADAFPESNLAPACNDPARGTYLRWMYFAAACVEPAVVDRRLGRPAPERPNVLGYGTYESTLDTVERAITPGPWLVGDRFTTADLCMTTQIGWGFMSKSIEPRPAFTEYVARRDERPAFQRAEAKTRELQARLQR